MVAALAHSTAVAFFERRGLQQKLAALQTAADQPDAAAAQRKRGWWASSRSRFL